MSIIDEMFEQYKENLIKICYYCGGEEFYEKVTDTVDWTVVEKKVICKDCNTVVNYWSYGLYENDVYSDRYKKALRRKKLERICS